jgi:hypothetical protein
MEWKMLVYFKAVWYNYVWYNLVKYMAVWYSLWSFVPLFPFWYVWTKKDLATLIQHGTRCIATFLPFLPSFDKHSTFFVSEVNLVAK